MSQADARACIQKGLSSITPQLDIVDALVLESVAVSVRCLPRPADGFVTETALYWTLYHAMLQFAASSDQVSIVDECGKERAYDSDTHHGRCCRSENWKKTIGLLTWISMKSS
jgi:hypothetical protein